VAPKQGTVIWPGLTGAFTADARTRRRNRKEALHFFFGLDKVWLNLIQGSPTLPTLLDFSYFFCLAYWLENFILKFC